LNNIQVLKLTITISAVVMNRNLMLSNLRIRYRANEAESTLGRAFAPVHLQIHVITAAILIVEAEVTGVAFELRESVARRLTMLVAGYPPGIEDLITVDAVVDHTEGYSGFLVCADSEGILSLLSGLEKFRGCRIYPY
jgi:hypothetical protein